MFCLILLYVAVIRLAKQGEIKNAAMGYVVPLLALVGSLFIVYGGLQNPLFYYYVTFYLIIVVIALFYYRINAA